MYFCGGGSAPPDPPIYFKKVLLLGGLRPPRPPDSSDLCWGGFAPQTPPFSVRIGRIGRSVGSVDPSDRSEQFLTLRSNLAADLDF